MRTEHQPLQAQNPVQVIWLLIGILTLVITALYHTVPPKASSLSAPSSAFSSARAMSHIQQIGTMPHPTGTRENDVVRQYLIRQLTVLGLKPEVQSTLIVNPKKKKIARINNVMVRIPGAKSSKVLLLSAHYDSVHTGPGAADDGASVAAILETLRAIKTQAPLQNDLICLFTDSEEDGLLGAEAFVQQHPWAKDVGLALNFEYRGNRGAFMMFETSLGNGKLIEGLAASAPYILANSLMYEVYKHLPNDTDLSVFKKAGMAGMNFAAIEGYTNYHTQLDHPELLSQDTLQQEGEIMLALVKHFGDISLTDLKAADRVYFDAPGLGLISYPISCVIPLSGFLMVLFAAVESLGLRKKAVRVSHVLLGAIAFLLIVFGLAIGSHFLWRFICILHPAYTSFFQGDTYNSHWYLLAFVFLNAGLLGYFQGKMGKWVNPIEFSFGVMVCWLLLLVASSVYVPGMSYLFFWPLTVMLVVIGMLLILNPPQSIVMMLIGLVSVPSILFFVPLIKNIYTGLTIQMIGAVMVCLLLLMGLLVPLLEIVGRRKTLLTSSLVLAFAFFITGSLTSGFDADHPSQNTLFYALNSEEKRAYWLSTDQQLDKWTSTLFANSKAKQQVPEPFGDSFPAMWVSPAPLLALQKPIIQTWEDNIVNDNGVDRRKIKVQIKSPRQAPKLKVFIEGTDVLRSIVAGQLYSETAQSHWQLDGIGLNNKDLIIEFVVKSGVPFKVKAIDFSYGLPAAILKPRPAAMISKPSEFSDTIATVNVLGYR
jgi:hypothetical protein